MRKIGLILMALSLINCASAQLRPIAPPRTIETAFPQIVRADAKLCIPIRFPIPYVNTFAQNICEYYEGNYQDGTLNLVPPVVFFVDVDYKVWRDTPFDEFKFHGNTFSIAEKIFYSADGYVIIGAIPVPGQCGWDDEAAREIVIGYDSEFGFSPDYSLMTKTKRRAVITPNRCLVTLADRDVTDNLTRLIERFMDIGANKVDELVPKLTNFKQPISHLWEVLQKPIKLDDNTWLTLGLTKLSGGQILVNDGNPQFVSTTVGLTFSPEIQTGHEPVLSPVPLPPLKLEDCAPGFELHPEVSFSFTDLESKLNNGGAQTTFQFGKRKLLVNHTRPYNSGQKTVLEVQGKLRAARPEHPRNRFFSNIAYFFDNIFYRKSATLYVVGTPSTETVSHDFRLANIQYDAHTKNIIRRKAAWIENTTLLTSLENTSRMSTSAKLENIKSAINTGLTKSVDNIQISSTTTSITPEKTFIYNDRIYCRYKLVIDLQGKYQVN
ncbi:DUF4403 family protein [Mucilaginibacter sp. 14171R-50]|uniref:DUF4403 family protein n=1 Tax=Mucilaginibacter sp. 14171R-50 TaxID=2703789 RepID=UPI00138C7861|nr:DUF4403 family protein [Mucilaginibacter sp. 14171R-50]QHS56533.1 DUF4403 family protein [Mucilaginibacter sp. 14171R-50]